MLFGVRQVGAVSQHLVVIVRIEGQREGKKAERDKPGKVQLINQSSGRREEGKSVWSGNWVRGALEGGIGTPSGKAGAERQEATAMWTCPQLAGRN